MKKKLENYWYHYKWHTIIAAFFVLVAVICIVQIAKRESYDIYIRYVGNAEIINTQYNDMLNAFEKIDADINGDGETFVNFARVGYINDKDNANIDGVNVVARETLSTMLVQPYYIYIMDMGAYEQYKDAGVFISLSQMFEGKYDSIANDEYSVFFKDTQFCKTAPGMEWVSDDMVMVLKIVPNDSVFTGKQAAAERESFDAHAEFFKTLVGE